MGFYRAYYKLPIGLQNAVFSLCGYYIRKKRYNRTFRDACRILRENEYLLLEHHKEKQVIALRKLLFHCAKNVRYYQKLFKRIKFDPQSIGALDDLYKLPVLEKSYVLKNPNDFVATNFKKKDLLLEETSGTSGSPLRVWYHKDFYAWTYALYETRLRRFAGLSIKDRRANLTGKVLVPAWQKKPPFWRYNIAEKQIYMSSYHLCSSNMPFYIEALKDFKPVYIIGYPSSIYPVAKYLVSSMDKIPSIKNIITSSECLLPETRYIIERGFGCKVYNHYGSVEWVASMSECEDGNLHLSPEVGIVEILDSNGNPVIAGEVGEMICTGLLNYAMPLIRYKTGDMGSFPETQKKCSCGRELPLLKSLEGRKMSFLSLPGGKLVGSATLSTAFHAKNILESKIIQESTDSIRLKLVVTDAFSEHDRDYLFTELEKRIAPLKINCDYVKSIPCEKGGKKAWIVNKMKSQII